MSAATITTAVTSDHMDYLAGEAVTDKVTETHKTRTVLTKADLPDELQWAWDGPGILFTNFLVDGTEVPQYRPDKTTKTGDDGKPLKYIFPSGIQNGPFISPLQMDLIAAGTAKEVIMAEGTKGGQAATSLVYDAGAIDDIIVIGIPGCWGGVQDGLHSSDYVKIIPAGATVTVFLDGDVAKKTGVWDAGDILMKHLDALGVEPRIAVLPVAGSNGISDYLGKSLAGMSPARKLEVVRRLADKARKTMPRRPAEKKSNKSAGGAKVMWDHEVIATTYTDDGGQERINETLLDAAVRPTAIRVEFDDLNPQSAPSSTFDLQVRKGGAVFDLLRISSTALNNPRAWLTKLPGGFGETITMKPRMGEDIGEAIRAGSGHAGAEVPVLTTLRRSGWYTRDENGAPVTRYVTGTFAIGPDDTVDDLTGRISDGRSGGLVYQEDPHTVNEVESAAAILELLRVADDLLIDGTAWTMGIGMHMRALAGGARTGGLIFTGTPGCGKTSVLRGLSSLQVPGADLDTFEGTLNAIAGMGRGLHHAVKYMDDVRDRSASGYRAVQAQHASLSALLRRMLQGSEGIKARERVDKDSGEIVAGAKESAEPVIMVTAELAAIPTGKGTESDLERCIIVEMDRETSFRRGGATELKELSANGTLHRANGAFVKFIAQMIEGTYGGSFKAFKAAQADLHTHFMDRLADIYPEVEAPRRYEVAANVLVGYKMLMTAAVSYEALEPEEANRRFEQVIQEVADAMLNHHKKFLGGAEGTNASVMDSLVSAVISGRYNVDDVSVPTPGATRLGWRMTLRDGKGTQAIAIMPKVAMEITGLTRQALNVSMLEYIIPDKDGGYVRKARMKGAGLVNAYVIPIEAWGAEEEPEYDEAD